MKLSDSIANFYDCIILGKFRTRCNFVHFIRNFRKKYYNDEAKEGIRLNFLRSWTEKIRRGPCVVPFQFLSLLLIYLWLH